MTPNLISIEQIEAAINAWRDRRPSTTGEARLCREARLLAEPYAYMIMNRIDQIAVSDLSAGQVAALEGRTA